MSRYEIPVLNLKAVVQETGLKSDTLRAWERRYGLPVPARTKGGHRLYSQRDVDVVRWLIARKGEGLGIKQAVELWRQLEADGQDPLEQMPAPPPPALGGDAVADLRQTWVSACLAFDEQRAERALIQAFSLYPPETVCLEVLQKGLAQIGQDWCDGKVTVQQEHFATALAVRRLDALLVATPPPSRRGRILAACPPGERHSFGLFLLTFLLRRRGWDVLYLGADVPLARMGLALQTVEPRLVILAAQRLPTAVTLWETSRLLRQQDVLVGFGGRVFNRLPALVPRIPGYFLGETLEGAPQVVEQLMVAPPPMPILEATVGDQQALTDFQDQQFLIEAQIWRTLEPSRFSYDDVVRVNAEIAHGIVSALTLGGAHLLGDSAEWLEGLCGEDRVSPELLERYMKVYHQAAQTHLGEAGAAIVDWLAAQASRGASHGRR
jgi:DNA-binding transcriptional MerR regulator